ncbi:hypothetical protein FRC08_015570 [Ceratobasidium sp. 394]|nr:hypothetical protein FRC08_015570 [Ceratobasidium sp. 394]
MLFYSFQRPIWAELKPLTYAAFGLFSNGQVTRSASSTTKYMLRNPSPTAPREVPTPLVILCAERWDRSSKEGAIIQRDN